MYVDTWETMAQPSGEPVAGIYIDGVHPSPKGYALWIDAMLASTREALP